MISHNPSKNKATPIVPIELSITLDGISGIRIGEQFSIPTNILPAAYKTNNGKRKINFIVTGLSHSIKDNKWVTTITSQTKVNE